MEPPRFILRTFLFIWFLEKLQSSGVKNIWGYDPVIENSELEHLGVIPAKIEEGFKSASAVFFMNNHKSYTDLDINSLVGIMDRPSVFFDGWNIFTAKDIQNTPGIIYASLGVG